MVEMKPTATLIGDVVASRSEGARRAHLHGALEHALETVNRDLAPPVPLRVTVGDEYQGCFASVGDACRASLRLRLALLPSYDVRHGIGWGPVTVLRDEPRVEDGPGWWAARAAIESIEDDAAKAALRGARTAYLRADGIAGPDAAAVNAALLLRDEVLRDLSDRSVMLAQGLVQGRTLTDIAGDLGVSPSALSQRVRRDGLGVLLRADELLGEVQ
jgi:hypothetical protein